MKNQLSGLELKEQFKSAEVNKLILAFAIRFNVIDYAEELHVKLFSDKCLEQMPKLLHYLAKQECVQHAEALDNTHLRIYVNYEWRK